MSTSQIQSMLQEALSHHQANRLGQAEQCYRQILHLNPHNFDATHLLGVLMYQQGRLDDGRAMICRAIEINPAEPAAFYNLGNLLRDQGVLDEAVAAYRQAILLQPQLAEAHNNLSLVLARLGHADEAIGAAQSALRIRPEYADALTNLGNALLAAGRLDESAVAHRRVIALQPSSAIGYSNLGDALAARGALDDAVGAYRQAIALNPNLPQPWCNLASALTSLEQVDEAIAAADRAIGLNPRLPQAHLNRGNALWRRALPEEAVECYRRAFELDPAYVDALNNLGNALKDLGQADEALRCFEQALLRRPNQPSLHSNRLYTMHFSPSVSDDARFRAHEMWGRSMAALASAAGHDNDRSPERLLRVGFVSPDLCSHPVGRFLAPIFDQHDREQFEFICFADAPRADAVTRRLEDASAGWHSILGLSDSQAANLIRAEKIDILVDLALHTRRNRLPVFARKPAPVQVTYLGYPGTTGLAAMDFRLTDRFLDPPGGTARYAERSIQLSGSYWCYEIPADAPPPGPLPASPNGFVTFGCLNNFCKVSPASLQLWSRILNSLPGSRLMLHAPPGQCRDRVRASFASEAKIEFVAYQTSEQYFKTYDKIDVALDPFPYNGGTTTCDALAMGVPVVTLAGQTATARAGASILSNANLPELTAHSADEYVRLACDLARDRAKLSAMRASLRGRIASAPLTDAEACARGIEGALRQMWRSWCAGISSSPPI